MKKFLLSGEDKIKKNSQFEQIIANGGKCANKFLVVFFMYGDYKKIGISVSRKIKPIVEKNRIKRILREIYRINKSIVKDKTNIIIVAKEHLRKKSFKTTEKAFFDVMNKARMLT